MPAYRVVVNWEWSSKCNACCATCPRHAAGHPIDTGCFEQTLARLQPQDVFRCVISGHRDPAAHPRFDEFMRRLRGHPVTFDMATNGSRLSRERLIALDGVLHTLMVSLPSVDPQVYQSVHGSVDQEAAMASILAARRLLRQTRLVVRLSPARECLDTLDDTVGWLRANGVDDLHMSPTHFEIGGAGPAGAQPDTRRLRGVMAQHGLRSHETAFTPGATEIVHQWIANRVKCVPRNSNMLITATGNYSYCFNDTSDDNGFGHVGEASLREALQRRERTAEEGHLCARCKLRSRHGPGLRVLSPAAGA
jgi:MoaA/NifB/PqqE/SkfB family radical SAM enzyme